jgi:pimeloyl-ACP methyl ester carboxylesterase
MTMERAVRFGEAGHLAGIVTMPGRPRKDIAVVLLNAGVVHRVGPNRMYVRTARTLAARGFLAVRFDLAGLGDSETRRDALPFEQAAVSDTRGVLSEVQREHGIDRFVLIGLCSGAVLSFRTAVADARVIGAVLLNPQGFGADEAWNAAVVERGRQRRLLRKAFSLRSWKRALTGRSDYRLASQLVWRGVNGASRDTAPGQAVEQSLSAEFTQLQARGVRLLLACSEGDYAEDYLHAILGADPRRLRDDLVRWQGLPAGDHSLTMSHSQELFLRAIGEWASALAAAPGHGTEAYLDAADVSAMAALEQTE